MIQMNIEMHIIASLLMLLISQIVRLIYPGELQEEILLKNILQEVA